MGGGRGRAEEVEGREGEIGGKGCQLSVVSYIKFSYKLNPPSIALPNMYKHKES